MSIAKYNEFSNDRIHIFDEKKSVRPLEIFEITEKMLNIVQTEEIYYKRTEYVLCMWVNVILMHHLPLMVFVNYVLA